MSALRRLRFGFLAVLSLTMALSIRPLRADEMRGFVRIACAPELGYFSIRRVLIMDLLHMGPYLTEGLEPGPTVVTALQRKYGVFDSGSLRDNPFECSIPEVQAVQGWHGSQPGYKVRVVGYRAKNGQEGDYHMIANDAEVFLQGKSLGRLVLNLPDGIDLIEVWHDDVSLQVRTCEIPQGADTGIPYNLTCRYEPFKAGVQ